jgi:hypothetical protein
MNNFRSVKVFLFFLIFALGLATIVVTLANGGTITSRGILFGGILCLMAALRLYLTVKHDA